MEDKSMKEMLKTAKSVSVKADKPDGYVYGYLNGKKEFFKLEDIYLASRKQSLGDLISELIEFKNNQIEKNKKIKKVLTHVLQENKTIKEGLKKYGMVD